MTTEEDAEEEAAEEIIEAAEEIIEAAEEIIEAAVVIEKTEAVVEVVVAAEAEVAIKINNMRDMIPLKVMIGKGKSRTAMTTQLSLDRNLLLQSYH